MSDPNSNEVVRKKDGSIDLRYGPKPNENRGRPRKAQSPGEHSRSPSAYSESSSNDAQSPQASRPRGRPPKSQLSSARSPDAQSPSADTQSPQAKRSRGRPRKNTLSNIPAVAQAPALATLVPVLPAPAPASILPQAIRPRGRPRKHPLPDPVIPEGPKRPRGRPRKIPRLDQADPEPMDDPQDESEDDAEPSAQQISATNPERRRVECSLPSNRRSNAGYAERSAAPSPDTNDQAEGLECFSPSDRRSNAGSAETSAALEGQNGDEVMAIVHPSLPDCHDVNEKDFEQTQYRTLSSHQNPLAERTASVLGQKAQCAAWHRLWKMALHIFGKSPYHLFSWGLREPDPPNPRLYEELSIIISHPIWQNDISRLRYAIQKAIAFRVQGHVEPIGPINNDTAEIIVQLPHNKRSESAMRVWQSTKMDTQYPGRDFIRHLSKQIEAEPVDWQDLNDTDVFFYVEIRDIFAIRLTLDKMAIPSPAHRTVHEYHIMYGQATQTDWRLMAPRSQETLERWDLWETKECLRRRENEEADLPGDERDLHTSLAYWNDVSCDHRMKYTFFPHLLDITDPYK
ncbi:hypothetical protein BJ166DRAFT_496496 [Pestalotiopsis sp. NC0098]|nr:hypothetical protein BJ166DRAFT_496496 [Pestalotiopsis sp. NC0098]